MRLIITSSLLLAVLCSFATAIPMEQPPKDFSFDNPGDFPEFTQPQLLPYNTSDCSWPNYDADPEAGMLSACLIECPLDPTCQTLGFNRTEISCACPAQYCPDGNLYGFPAYKRGEPLTPEKIAIQPHVKAACFGCVGAEVSPNKTQIGDCSSRCVSTTKIYHPNQDPANSNPNLNPAESHTTTQEGSGSGESDPTTVTYKPEPVTATCLDPAESKN